MLGRAELPYLGRASLSLSVGRAVRALVSVSFRFASFSNTFGLVVFAPFLFVCFGFSV